MKTLKSPRGKGINSLLHISLLVLVVVSLFFAVSCQQPVYHSVVFKSNGGSSVADQSIQDGQCATKPDNPMRDSYEFVGWYSDTALTVEYNFSTPVTADLTLYAKWVAVTPPVKTTYTVDFMSLGGTQVESQEIESGKCATEPDNPRRGGYEFDGWYTERAYRNLYDFATPVTSDLTLYAKWKGNTADSVTFISISPDDTKSLTNDYDLVFTFKSNGVLEVINGGESKPGTWSIEDGTIAVPEELATIKLYSSKENQTKIPSFADLKECKIVYAGDNISMYEQTNYETGKCAVKFESNGGSPVDDQLIDMDDRVERPTDPIKAFYTFEGWYSDVDCKTTPWDFNSAVQKNMNLYAKWKHDNCVLFTSSDEFTITVSTPAWLAVSNPGYIEYSTDGNSWKTWEPSTKGGSTEVSVTGTKIGFRGKGNTVITTVFTGPRADRPESYGWIITGEEITDSKVSVSGNIMTLLDYENLGRATMGKYCFAEMFSGQTALVSAENLELPATQLTENCYFKMFLDCTSLKKAPALPAESLADYCYQWMFKGCTSLTSAPALPAGSLADSCYYGMFLGCTSLTSAPALPAESLAEHCYYQMFKGCTSLKKAPALPATTLTDRCYFEMFKGCTSLTTAPVLPAESLATNCYCSMFSGCTSLTSAPALPAGSLANYCYNGMFSGCTSLRINNNGSSGTLFFTCPDPTGLTTPVTNMFASTGGTYTSDPVKDGTYYWY